MFKKFFLTGLGAIVPVVITVYVVVALFRFADGFLGKFINRYFSSFLGYSIPGLGIIITVVIIFLVGVLIHISRMRLVSFIEKALFSLPIVNKIYTPIKKIFDFLFSPSRKSFKTTVLVEYPRKGIYSVGFITNESSPYFCQKTGKKLYNVFIPSSPSPITGFTIIVDEKEIIFLDIEVDEAIKLLVSGGLINP